jgi:paraquat-inducible protein A
VTSETGGPLAATLACPACGAFQVAPAAARAALACFRCDIDLRRPFGRQQDVALAISAVTLLLLFPAYMLPLAKTTLLGATRESYAGSGALVIWRQGYPVLGAVIGLFGVGLPFARFGLLTLGLGALRAGRRGASVGRVLRLAFLLETWAMNDVYLLAFWVAWSRVTAKFPATPEPGMAFFIAAGVGALLCRALIDKPAVWRALMADAPAGGEAGLACPACDLVLPTGAEGSPCPRCAERVEARKAASLSRTAALTLAGVALYGPANLMPTAVVVQQWRQTGYNIFNGIEQIFDSNLVILGLLVSATSFLIPLFKLIALCWFVLAARRRSGRALRARTKLHRALDEIGRWSMADPFTVSFVLPLMQYGELTSTNIGPGALAFSVVVVATMLATRAFDPRLAWDVAGRRGGR